MLEILKLASDDGDAQIDFAGNENHLFFQIEKRLLLSRKLTGNFPDYERVLPKEHAHSVSIGRDDLRSALERVAQFCGRTITGDSAESCWRVSCKVHSSISETGESEETIPVEYDGPGSGDRFQRAVPARFPARRGSDGSRISFQGFEQRGRIAAGRAMPEGDQYRYVVMPMRI